MDKFNKDYDLLIGIVITITQTSKNVIRVKLKPKGYDHDLTWNLLVPPKGKSVNVLEQSVFPTSNTDNLIDKEESLKNKKLPKKSLTTDINARNAISTLKKNVEQKLKKNTTKPVTVSSRNHYISVKSLASSTPIKSVKQKTAEVLTSNETVLSNLLIEPLEFDELNYSNVECRSQLIDNEMNAVAQNLTTQKRNSYNNISDDQEIHESSEFVNMSLTDKDSMEDRTSNDESEKTDRESINKRIIMDDVNVFEEIVMHSKNKTKLLQLTSKDKNDLTCPYCFKVFCRKKYVNDHINNIHINPPAKNFKCSICDKSYKHVTHLKIHLRQHSGEKPYVCKICEKAFFRKTHLDNHGQTHNRDLKKYFKCDICKSMFKHKTAMMFHRKRKHFSDNNDKGGGLSNYTFENVIESIDNTIDSKEEMLEEDYVLAYKCVYCFQQFELITELTTHMKTHSFKNK